MSYSVLLESEITEFNVSCFTKFLDFNTQHIDTTDFSCIRTMFPIDRKANFILSDQITIFIPAIGNTLLNTANTNPFFKSR